MSAARGVVDAGRGFFEGQKGVGYGVAEFEDFERLRREAREQDAREGNPEATGAELEVIAGGTKEVGAEDLRVLLEVEEGRDRPLIIDVRAKNEFAEGHVPGALMIPLSELEGRAGGLEKGRAIVAYASSITGGVDASYVLKRAGFTDVRSLAGGFDAWTRVDGPVVRGV